MKKVSVLFFLFLIASLGLFAQDSGGPDEFGYTWRNSNHAQGPEFSWVTPGGTSITTGWSDDTFQGPFPIGFNFPYYDNVYSDFYVSSNGYISFGAGYTHYFNGTIPTVDDPNNAIFLYWDDFGPNNTTPQAVWYETTTVNGTNALVVTYDSWPRLESQDQIMTAQIILFPNGDIIKQYSSFTNTFVSTSGTIGIENATGTDGLLYQFDTDNIDADMAIRYYCPVPASNDLQAVSVSGSNSPTVGIPEMYEVVVRNRGSVTQSTYQVRLMGTGNTVLATLPGVALAANISVAFTFFWTPATEGLLEVWGEVELTGDENPTNDETEHLQISVLPEGVVSALVGDPASNIWLTTYPLNVYWWNSLTEVIYYPEELNGAAGMILGVKYYNDFFDSVTPKPTTIFMGETTQTDLSTGWIPADQLTQVWDGNLELPQGQNEITIMFTTPYVYGGGNLVVLIDKEDTGFDGFDNNFQLTDTPQYPNRAIETHMDGEDFNYDPFNPPADFISTTTVPNTMFIINTSGMGSLAGTVTSGGAPVEGASLWLSDFPAHQTSLADGSYLFPFVTAGTFTLNASKHGYFDASVPNVVIESDTQTMQNITMTPLPTVTVSGMVVRNDNGMPAQNASVGLYGYENYEGITTNMAGQFSIPNVYSNNEYQIVIEYPGFSIYTGTVTVGTSDLDAGTITVVEIAFPAHHLSATPSGDDSSMNLVWQTPLNVQVTAFDFESDDGGFISSDPAAWQHGVPVATTAHSGTNVWATVLAGAYTAGLWTLDSPEIPVGSDMQLSFWHWYEIESSWDGGNVVVSTDGGNNWNLLTPVGGYPGAGNADNPLGQGTPCFTGWMEEWQQVIFDLSEYVGEQVIFRFNFGADPIVHLNGWYIDDFRVGPPEEEGLDRERTGYNVYRFLMSEQGNPDLWQQIASSVQDTTYIDAGWATVPTGVYKYGVKAVYTGGYESGPTKSNWVPKNMTAPVTLNVTTNVGDIPVGASIRMVSLTPDPDEQFPVYEILTGEAGSATIPNVWMGTYNITISLTNFDTVVLTSQVIDGPEVYNVELVEQANPPYNVQASITQETQAQVSWHSPGGNTYEFRWDDGTATAQIGYGANPAAVMGNVHRYNALITDVSWFLTNDAIHTEAIIHIFGLDAAGFPDVNQHLYESPVLPNTDLQWNIHQLPVPVEAPNGFLVGVCTPNVFTALGTDDGIGEPWVFQPGTQFGISDWTEGTNSWDDIGDYGFTFNMTIRAHGINLGAVRYTEQQAMPTPGRQNPFSTGGSSIGKIDTGTPRYDRNISNTRVRGNNRRNVDTREVLDYTVYRLFEGNEDNPSTWSLIGTTPDTTIVDVNFGDQDPDVYRFAVIANYFGDNHSNPAFSNTLPNQMMVEAAITVTTNSNDPTFGASITLTNTDGNPDHIYYANIPQSGTTTVSVWRGIYNVLVELPGFSDYSSTHAISDNATLSIQLMEIRNPIRDLSYTVTGNDVSLLWLAPAIGGTDDNVAVHGLRARAVSDSHRNNMDVRNPANRENDSRHVTGYKITRYTNNNPTIVQTLWQDVEYFDMNVPAGVTFYSIVAVYSSGESAAEQTPNFVIQDVDDPTMPVYTTALSGNFPNPFNPVTRVQFSLATTERVTIDIYNLKGQKVKTLVNGVLPAGRHEVIWNGEDEAGSPVSSGVYFYNMKSGTYTSTQKMILLK